MARQSTDLHSVISAFLAEMQAERDRVTLADVEKARCTQSFAKLRAAYSGSDSDEAILAHLMQGER